MAKAFDSLNREILFNNLWDSPSKRNLTDNNNFQLIQQELAFIKILYNIYFKTMIEFNK